MNSAQVLAKILEDNKPIRKLELVPKKTKSFNDERKEIREMILEGWLKPYYQVYLEIVKRVKEKTPNVPDPDSFDNWLKEMNKRSDNFWSNCIQQNLGMDEGPFTRYHFTWGNAKFSINNDLASIYSFYKALNKRI